MGIPSIAVSLNTFVGPHFQPAAVVGRKIVQVVYKKGLPLNTFLNVNVPDVPTSKIRGIKFTRQGIHPIHGTFQKKSDPNLRNYWWMTGRMPPLKKDDTYDTNALGHDFVTVTPIQCDLTDYRFLPQLQDWKI